MLYREREREEIEVVFNGDDDSVKWKGLCRVCFGSVLKPPWKGLPTCFVVPNTATPLVPQSYLFVFCNKDKVFLK